MHRRFFFLALLSLFAFPFSVPAQDTVHTWESYEISLQGSLSLPNPYVDTESDASPSHLTAVFSGVDGEAQGKTYTLKGFWDGDKTWTVRFAPPFPGVWEYKTASPDPSLNNQTGRFTAQTWSSEELNANPTRRGFLFVNRQGDRAGRYFSYADNTPFLWIGDTWWNWCKRDITLDSFKKLANDRSAKGFTVGQLFFAGRGWGRSASLLDPTYTQPKIEQIHAVEEMIRYANSKGITVWIHGWWGGKNIDQNIGAESMRRWWRYTVHRLAAYNVIWVLAGEYNLNNYGGLGLDFWKDLGQMIKDEDPYKRMVSAHPTPPAWDGGAEAPQWSTAEVLHNEPWLDYNQSQVGHSQWRNELIPSIITKSYQMIPPKPIVVTEPWYEFIKDNPTAKDIRFAAWTAILSGAAGHTYGGGHVWKAHVPEAPAGKDSWPMDMDFDADTLNYPGAQSMAFLSKFLNRIEWWKLEPHPEFVIDNPSPYCAANPGKEYLAYLRIGGTVRMDLRNAEKDADMQYSWYDLVNSKPAKEGHVKGGEIVEISAPGDYPGTFEVKDWLLHVWRAQ